jgi:arginase family enzyme
MTSAWPNLHDLLTRDEAAPVGWVGAPLGAGSVTPGRCDLAPGELRKVLKRIGRYDVERLRELSTFIADHGNVTVEGSSIKDALNPLRDAVGRSIGKHALTLLIGGNNAVTRAAVHGVPAAFDEIGLITLDAHFDMRPLDAGLSNGNPVSALRADGLPGRNIAQIGLAPFANSAAMHQAALEGGHLVVTIDEVHRRGITEAVGRALVHLAHCETIVVDCDIDVIDRSQFPGAPGARPGGMTARDFFAGVRRLAAEPKVRVIDLTEWDPPLDPTDLSALTAGRWLAEVLSGFEERP